MRKFPALFLFLTVMLSIVCGNAIADEKHTFWSNVDEFLGKVADGVSKQDAITGLRTIDSPFHNEEDYRKQGEETLNLILRKAKKDGVRVFEPTDPEFIRVKEIVDRLVDASHYRNHKEKVKYAVIDYEDFNALAFGGGYFVVFTGLMKQTNDDELTCVIAHELAHNTAGHIEESFFLRAKDVFGDNQPKSMQPHLQTSMNRKQTELQLSTLLWRVLTQVGVQQFGKNNFKELSNTHFTGVIQQTQKE